jgi:hypothetical protein
VKSMKHLVGGPTSYKSLGPLLCRQFDRIDAPQAVLEGGFHKLIRVYSEQFNHGGYQN